MRNYTFYNYKGGKTLFPKNDWLTGKKVIVPLVNRSTKRSS